MFKMTMAAILLGATACAAQSPPTPPQSDLLDTIRAAKPERPWSQRLDGVTVKVPDMKPQLRLVVERDGVRTLALRCETGNFAVSRAPNAIAPEGRAGYAVKILSNGDGLVSKDAVITCVPDEDK